MPKLTPFQDQMRSNGHAPNQWVYLVNQKFESLDLYWRMRSHSGLKSLSLPTTPTLNSPSPWAFEKLPKSLRSGSDSRVRRALLRKPTPIQGPFPVGSYVYFFRLQTPARSNRSYRWFGPARVIGCELRSPERLADPAELPTEGGQPRACWLRYGHTVVCATGGQLRFASEDELIAAHSVPQEVL